MSSGTISSVTRFSGKACSDVKSRAATSSGMQPSGTPSTRSLFATAHRGKALATANAPPRVAWRILGPLLLAAALAPSAALAGTSGNVALTSDYVFRGVSQSNEEPALQGGVEYAHDSGFYVGAWGSSISWLSDIPGDISSSLELDGYLGYRGSAGEIFAYDVGVLTYYYPGDFPDGFSRADTTEVYLGGTLTPVENLSFGLKYSYAVTELFGYVDSKGSGYLDASVNWTVGPGWTVGLHGGKQWIDENEDFEYTDWKLGVTKAFDNGFSVGAAYTDTDAEQALYTNAHGNEIADGRFALTLMKAF